MATNKNSRQKVDFRPIEIEFSRQSNQMMPDPLRQPSSSLVDHISYRFTSEDTRKQFKKHNQDIRYIKMQANRPDNRPSDQEYPSSNSIPHRKTGGTEMIREADGTRFISSSLPQANAPSGRQSPHSPGALPKVHSCIIHY